MATPKQSEFDEASKLVHAEYILPERVPGEGAVVVMRDGSFRSIIRTGSLNFDLKSPTEQSRVAYGFGYMCDSIEDFPIQIFSHSKLIDIRTYTHQYEYQLNNRNTPPQVKEKIRSHLEHFEDQIQQARIMSREIYVVIPYKGNQDMDNQSHWDDLPGSTLINSLKNSIEGNMNLKNTPDDQELSLAQMQLDSRTRHICSRLNGLNIWTRPLGEEDVRRLLYSLFHPSLSERQSDPGETPNGLGGFSTATQPIRRGHEDAYEDFG